MDRTDWNSPQNSGQYPQAEGAYYPDAQFIEEVSASEVDMLTDDYPFEEPEQAPELRSERSENVYSRNEPFWNRVVELPRDGESYPRDPNYWNHPEELSDERMLYVDSDHLSDKLRKFLGARALWITLGVIAVITAVGLLLSSAFLQVKRIEVVGNVNVPAEEIIAASQLQIGMSTLNIDHDAVAARISRRADMVCTLVDVSFDKVTLHVHELQPVTYLIHNGMTATLDNRGRVLDLSREVLSSSDSLIRVSMNNVTRCNKGQNLKLSTGDLSVYTQILVELKAMGWLQAIGELDMTRMDSITLKTRDGVLIRMGNQEEIHQKLRAATIVYGVVMAQYSSGGVEGGTIIVVDPVNPSYMPPST